MPHLKNTKHISVDVTDLPEREVDQLLDTLTSYIEAKTRFSREAMMDVYEDLKVKSEESLSFSRVYLVAELRNDGYDMRFQPSNSGMGSTQILANQLEPFMIENLVLEQVAEDPITKFTQILQRDDGSEVKIVATGAWFPKESKHLDIYHRQSKEDPWCLVSMEYPKEYRTMSRSEYLKSGRPEGLVLTTFGERHRCLSMLFKSQSEFQNEMDLL